MVLPDQRLRRRPPAISMREFLHTFWVSPRRHPDFAWAWISRGRPPLRDKVTLLTGASPSS